MAVEHWAKNPSSMSDDLTYLVEDEEYTIEQHQIGSLLWTGIVLDSPPAYKELPYPGSIKVKCVRQSDSFQYTETGLQQAPSTTQFNVDYDALDHVNNVQLPGYQTTGRIGFNNTEIGEVVLVSYWATGPGVTIGKTVKMLAGKTIPGALSTTGLVSAGTGVDFTNNKGVNLANGTASGDAVNFGQLGDIRSALYDTRRSFLLNWVERVATATDDWTGLAFGENIAVAVSLDGTIMTSRDGIKWTSRTAAEANQWQDVCYSSLGSGRFIAVSSDGANRVMYSLNGTSWTAASAAAANQWSSVTSSGSIIVAVSQDGANRVMTSPDGITWTARTAASANIWRCVRWISELSLFVAVGEFQADSNLVMTSPDGITWTARSCPDGSWTGLAYGDGILVAVSAGGSYRVMTSTDAITWTERTEAPTSAAFNDVAYFDLTHGSDSQEDGLFVAVGVDGVISTSPDGITWTQRDTPVETVELSAICQVNDRLVVVGDDGDVITSLNVI